MTGRIMARLTGCLSFIVKQDSDVKVAYTVELDEMIQKLEDNTWNPEAEN